MSVVDISLFRWFCQFIHCLRFMLETLHLLVLHCIITLLYIYIYIYIYKYTLHSFTLTCPNYTPSPLPLPTAQPFHSHLPTYLSSYIKMINKVYLFFAHTTCVVVVICIQDVIFFRKYFDIVVSKFIIISKFTRLKWLYALKCSFRFNYSLQT